MRLTEKEKAWIRAFRYESDEDIALIFDCRVTADYIHRIRKGEHPRGKDTKVSDTRID